MKRCTAVSVLFYIIYYHLVYTSTTRNKNFTCSHLPTNCLHNTGLSLRAGGWGFPWLLSKENRRKIEPKEIPSCLIPCLLAVFTWQIEILVTAL